MKKYTVLFPLFFIIALVGCSSYIPFSYPDNSLNIYNTYWDNFAGSIEKGKVYYYSNKGFSPELQFKVTKVLGNGNILVNRDSKLGWAHNFADYGHVCEAVQFLIVSDYKYADDAKLRDGEYVCCGTFNLKYGKTVYILTEKQLFDKRNLQKLNINQVKDIKNRFPENCLNIYNTFYDNYSGTIEEGKVYNYTNDIADKDLLFEIIQVWNSETVLACRRGNIDTISQAYLLILSDYKYANGAKLRNGEYVCVGTHTYETKTRDKNTVYVLAEKSFAAKIKDKKK